MFFFLSKTLWWLLAPVNLLLILLCAGTAFLFTRFVRFGRALVSVAALGFLVAGVLPTGTILMRQLEDRFPRPPAIAQAPAGIIVLGGGVDEVVTAMRGPLALTAAGDRMTEAAMLARRFPQAKLVFTGGSASLLGSSLREAHVAQRLFIGLGLPPEQLVFEQESRNTYENAMLTRDLVKPQPGQRWLLVTSAAHMPRAAGIFRKAGFQVTPYPVDYRTPGSSRDYRLVSSDILGGLTLTETAVREYLGLAAYWFAGKTDALFPAPEP